MKKYKSVRIEEHTHVLLQKYCKEHGCSMNWLIHKLISEMKIPKNVLRVQN